MRLVAETQHDGGTEHAVAVLEGGRAMVPFGRLSYGGGAQPRATMFGRDEIAVDLFDAGIGVAVRVVHRDEQVRRRAGTIPDAHFEPPLALRLLGDGLRGVLQQIADHGA